MVLPYSPLTFANNAQTTLTASTTGTATSITVASSSAFPATGNFVILIDQEVMLVTAVSGTAFTVVRALENTTATVHASGATVSHVLSAGIMTNIFNLNNNFINVLNGINGTYALVADGTTDNAAALNGITATLVQRAQAAATTNNIPEVIFPAGTYKFLSGVKKRPWIKWVMQGNVVFDFTSLGTSSQYAIRDHNQDAPYVSGQAATSTTRSIGINAINGALLINGPGSTVGTIRGLDISNNRVNYLAATINSSQTTITINDNLSLPEFGNYYIVIDSETLLVTAGQGSTTLTVQRGVSGSTAATHNSGVAVIQTSNIWTDYRDVTIASGVTVVNFYNDLYVQPFDGYGYTIADCRFSASTNCIFESNYQATQENNGEKISFTGCFFDSSSNALYCDSPANDITFLNCSFDYLTNSIMTLTSNAGYCKKSLIECHIENFPAIAVFSGSATASVYLQFTNVKGVLTTYYITPTPVNGTNTLAAAITTTTGTTLTLSGTANLPAQDNYVLLVDTEKMLVTAGQGSTTLTVQRGFASTTAGTHAAGAAVSAPGALASGKAAPWTNLVRGPVNLAMDGMVMGYSNYYAWANENSLFICDPTVQISKMQNVVVPNALISRAGQLLYNGNFNLSTNGINLDQTDTPGWCRQYLYNVSATIDNSLTYNASANALKFTATGSGNYFTLFTDAVRVPAAQGAFMSNIIAHGGTSTGVMHIETDFYYYMEHRTCPASVSSITRSGNTATVTTATNHNLVSNQFVEVQGASVADYNRRSPITVTGTNTFTYIMYSNTTAASPAVAASGAVLQYLPENLVPCTPANKGSYGINWSTMYADTTQPNYTGNRLWWAKDQYVTNKLRSGMPQGCTHLRLYLTISGLNTGDVIHLGEVIANYA